VRNDAIVFGRVLGAMDERLVEHDRLAVAPAVAAAVDLDVAAIVARRHEPEVVAQRARVRIAVLAKVRAGRELGEHRRLHGRNRAEDPGRRGTELAR
jgi:hypothetical protein